jgi:hypothetical protein
LHKLGVETHVLARYVASVGRVRKLNPLHVSPHISLPVTSFGRGETKTVSGGIRTSEP